MKSVFKLAVVLLAAHGAAVWAQPPTESPKTPSWGPSWVGDLPPGGFPRPKKLNESQTVIAVGESGAPVGICVRFWGDAEVRKGDKYRLDYQLRVHTKKGEVGPLLGAADLPAGISYEVASGTADDAWNGLEGAADVNRKDLSGMKNLPSNATVALRVEPQLYDVTAGKYVTPAKTPAVIVLAKVGKDGRVESVVSLRSWVVDNIASNPDKVLDRLGDLDECDPFENGFGEAVEAVLAVKTTPTATKARAIREMPKQVLQSKNYYGLLTVIKGFADGDDADLKAAAKAKLKEAQPPQPAEPAARPGALKLVPHDVTEQNGKRVVTTQLVPAEWKARDKFEWYFDDPDVPVRYQGRFYDPNGLAAVEFYPDSAGAHSSSPAGETGAKPPNGALDALKTHVRAVRPNLRARIVHEKAAPGEHSIDRNTGVEITSESATVRVEYEIDGRPVEEEFFGVMTSSLMISNGVVRLQSVVWRLNDLYSWRAPKGQLDQVGKVAHAIRASAVPTLEFFNDFMQVKAILLQIGLDRIREEGVRAKIFSEMSSEISQAVTDQYWETRRAQEKLYEKFSDSLRGLDVYQASRESTVKLPSGYEAAWVNDRGEYLMIDRDAYDPNHDLDGNWKKLAKGR